MVPTVPPAETFANRLVQRRLTVFQFMRGHAVAASIPGRIDIEVAKAPIVMTKQAVAFSTAAAVPLRTAHWWTAAATSVVGLAVDVVALVKDQLLSGYPPRLDFLDSSRTEREMHRL
jgi:hypothetical protein